MPRSRASKHAEVGRFFRGLPVIDATEPIRIVPNRADIKNGKRLDPNNCVFAQYCRRVFNSHAVLFLRRTAYVELPDAKGNRQVNRFNIPKSTADAIAHYDKTGEAPEGGFVLIPPAASRTLEAHREYSKNYHKEVFYGKRTPTVRPISRKTQKSMYGVRDGRGKLGINYAF